MNNQEGLRRATQDALSHRTEDESSNAASTVAAHDDQGEASPRGDLDNSFLRARRTNQSGPGTDLDLSGQRLRTRKCLRSYPFVCVLVLCARGERWVPRVRDREQRLQDVEEDDLPVDPLGESQRMTHALIAARAAVGGDKNPSVHRSLRIRLVNYVCLPAAGRGNEAISRLSDRT